MKLSLYPNRSLAKIAGVDASGNVGLAAAPTIVPESYGAVADGVTDDTTALQAALTAASAFAGKVIAKGNYLTSATINIPPGVTLEGASFCPGNPPTGSSIIAGASVTPVINVGTINNNAPASLRRMTISRSGGVPGATLVGVQAFGYNPIVEDVMSYNQGVGFYLAAQPATGTGISIMLSRCYTGIISGNHIVLDGWPEVRLSQCRFGMNGTGDQNCNAYIQMKGGQNGTSAGPNTLNAANCQFNQGANKPSYWIDCVSLAANIPGVDASFFFFTGCHVEGFSSAAIHSDATWNQLSRWVISGVSFNEPTIPFFSLNAGTQLSQFRMIGCQVFTGAFTLAPTAQFDGLEIIACYFLNAVSITSNSAGSTASIIANAYSGGLTVAGAWGSLYVIGSQFFAGSLTNSATGVVTVIDNSGISASTNAVVTGYLQPGVGSVASLPAASSGNKGARYMVDNATQSMTAGIGATVVGGGGNTVPVYSDGTVWRIG